MILQIVNLRSDLPEEELLRIAHERAPQFRALEGLIQKYYVRGENPGEFRGIYVWDSPESLAAFRDSDLAKTIAAAYRVAAPPKIEVAEILFPLRD